MPSLNSSGLITSQNKSAGFQLAWRDLCLACKAVLAQSVSWSSPARKSRMLSEVH